MKSLSVVVGLLHILVVIFLLFFPLLCVAQFSWTFERHSDFTKPPERLSSGSNPNLAKQSCGREGETDIGCGGGAGTWSNQDSQIRQTPFLSEVYRMEDGKDVFHMIIGEPQYGFAQEVYIRVGYVGPTRLYTAAFSTSKGDATCRYRNTLSMNLCNASDPMGDKNGNDFSGGGSANPKQVAIRQVMGGSWDSDDRVWSCQEGDKFCQDFLKDSFANKPVITQTNRDLDQAMEAHWQMDMSHIDYDTSAAGVMTNKVNLAAAPGDFDFEKQAQEEKTYINAGKFVYTGSDFGESAVANAYFYDDGGFNLDRDWTSFRDPDQLQYASDKCTAC